MSTMLQFKSKGVGGRGREGGRDEREREREGERSVEFFSFFPYINVSSSVCKSGAVK